MSGLRGGCHCGAIGVEIETPQAPAAISPRACDCGFCTRHGAAWVSDPRGRLVIRFEPAQLRRYRQGDELAEFLLCRRCGVLVAVTREHGRRYAAVNARALADGDGFGPPQPVSPARLAATEKLARWEQAWFAEVDLRPST